MAKYIVKRLVYVLIVFIILSLLMFLVYNMIPYDKASSQARAEVQANKKLNYEERYTYWVYAYGQDGNVFTRYLRWMGIAPFNEYNSATREVTRGAYSGLLQGNLGYSYQKGKGVDELIGAPMRVTILLNVIATILALSITIPLGIFCAVKKGSKRDTAVQVGTIVGYSIPTFIVAILFIFLFAVVVPIFPVSGYQTAGNSYTGARLFIDKLYHLALPLIVMTFASLGGMTRYVRASMIEALSMDCIRTARAKGVREKVVIYSHAWRNALIPIVTLVVGWFLGIFGGSVMIENIFGLNGMGRLYYEALNSFDYEVVLAIQLFYVFVALVGNLIIDLLYGVIDPRIRVSK